MAIEKKGGFDKSPKVKEGAVEKTELKQDIIKGTVKRWNPERGFGFIALDDGRNVFCHVNELCSHIRPPRGQAVNLGTRVNVKKVSEQERGFSAEQVECDDCATPEQWELQPSGTEIFGVRELKPVCVNKKNRPNFYSTIPYEEVLKANEPYQLAVEKESLWGSREIGERFFQVFGEPTEIRVDTESKIALIYPHGQRIINSDTAMHSQHWEMVPAPASRYKEEEQYLKAEFYFPEIPGAKAWRAVARLSINPELYEAFDSLPLGTQKEILDKVKENILSPGDVAEKHFDDFIKNEQERIEKFRNDLHLLQVPGELVLTSRDYTTQRAATQSYGGETWKTGDYWDETTTVWLLITGAKKLERPTWRGEGHTGGHEFRVNRPSIDTTPEQIRDELIAETQQKLEGEFKRAKEIKPPPEDPRLYTLDSTEWTKQYNERWDEIKKATQDKWALEEAQSLAEAEQSWREYEEVVEDLHQARAEVSEAKKPFRFSEKVVEHIIEPDSGNIGSDTIYELRNKIVALRAYAEEIAKYGVIESAKKEEETRKKEVIRNQEEAVQKIEEEQSNLEVEKFGVTGEYLKIARALAIDAVRKLGKSGASELFEETYHANYGRAGRQVNIKDALGNGISEEASRFFSLGRARDVDPILYAVQVILDDDGEIGTEQSQSAGLPDESSEPEREETAQEIKIENLPKLADPIQKGWWVHQSGNTKHSNKLTKADKMAYEAGERIDVQCSSCPGNPVVGYLQK